MTNNAAAALMFPIAAEAAERQGESLMSISFLVMLAASASFMSPFGQGLIEVAHFLSSTQAKY